jgi:hypothetical protein
VRAAPGKNLQKFIAANFGIQPRERLAIVESIGDAVSDVAVGVREAMKLHDGFDDIGKRMLLAWAEGVRGLCEELMQELCINRSASLRQHRACRPMRSSRPHPHQRGCTDRTQPLVTSGFLVLTTTWRCGASGRAVDTGV